MSQSHGSKDYIVFSVERKEENDATNSIRTEAVFNILTQVYGINVVAADGVYMGDAERSLIVNIDNERVVKQLCEMHNQECYMVARTHHHGLRKAFFVYPDGREEFQGYLRSVPKEVAEAADGFTYRADLGTYWIIDNNDKTMMSA